METNKIYYTWSEFNKDVNSLYEQINASGFKPELILGVTRGGTCLATVLSYKLNIPVVYFSPKEISDDLMIFINRLLIVDDINDKGNTFKNILNNIEEYESFQGRKVEHKLLAIHNNTNSIAKIDYYVHNLDKKEEDWIVYPWEEQF